MTDRYTGQGSSAPLGATVLPGGVNFSVFSRDAGGMELLLFDRAEDSKPSRRIVLDPLINRTYHYWHTFVQGIGPGQIYGWRTSGPNDPDRGLRFDPGKVLLDPYGKAVAVPRLYNREAACRPGDNTAFAMKSVVTDPEAYDWGRDAPLNRPFSKTVIYEMHVGGFTKHPSSGVPAGQAGTYAGLAAKIPYLKDLGVTAVELMPVFAFDPFDCPPGLANYWGYCPVSFFAPHPFYSSRRDLMGPLDEFRDMVKALHRAGIEVILDVVFNHTAEGDARGPTYSFKGLANDLYYILEADRSHYANYTGCGNTLNTNQPLVRRLILDSLRYWVREMHVDGFRFDLASILCRNESGALLENPPVVWDIESDPLLAGTKLIAEAWDAGGLYQVGIFAGDSWKEWNGKFRDDVRSFIRGDEKTVQLAAKRLLASPDIYAHENREPEQSINFVTCHDGFTLNDTVSYDGKHNEANREGNRDGNDDNRSWNCGTEGPSNDPPVEQLRSRQVKNFFAVTLLSLGTPMILMGDEVRRSQRGNNNAYCQDNELNWFDWTLLEKHKDVHRFVRLLIEGRLRLGGNGDEGDRTLNEVLKNARIQWHGLKLNQPDWSDWSHSLAFTLEHPGEGVKFHTILNAYWEPLSFEIPPVAEGWRRWIDTALSPPEDILPWSETRPVPGPAYPVGARSVVVLMSSVEGTRFSRVLSRWTRS